MPTEQWVHNLEHGYAAVLYDCRGDCDEALLQNLESFVATVPASSVSNPSPRSTSARGSMIEASSSTSRIVLLGLLMSEL